MLLATDAAGEGLNLQLRCRLVVNLELPWNPMRLEQRIGRVDRIGQQRTVHAINLLASGTAESGLLLRLASRIDQVRHTVGAVADVLGGGDEGLMAACLGLPRTQAGVVTRCGPDGGRSAPRTVERLDLGSAAREVAARLARQRQLVRASETARRRHPAGTDPQRAGGILAAAVRRSKLPVALGRSGLLAVFRVREESQSGLAPSETLVPVFVEAPCPRLLRRRDVRIRASAAMTALVPQMAAAIAARCSEPARTGRGATRDERLAACARARSAVQRGLFDRRAERDADEDEAPAAAVALDSAATQPPQPLLLLFVTP